MTNLPNESDGNTVQAGRWNSLLAKIQNASDTDTRIRGRVATFGTVISLSAASFVGLSGAAGYYGVRAETYITSGNGSDGNPYNLSAIESAVNALPAVGGTVFIKAGVYRGANRLLFGGTGQAARGKSIQFVGEGSDLSALNWANYQAVSDRMYGTVWDGGAEINTYGCLVSFRNIYFRRPGTGECLKFVGDIDDETITQNNVMPIGGFRLQDCKIEGGDPAIYITHRNVSPGQEHQVVNVLIERVHIRQAAQAIKIDDSPQLNGIFRGNIRHLFVQGCGGSGTDPAIDVNIANLKGTWFDWLVEDSGSTGAGGFAVKIRGGRCEGFELSNVDFGDNVRSPKGTYFECGTSGQMTIRDFVFRKNIEIVGYVDAQLGRAAQFGDTGTINVNSAPAGGVIIRKMRGLAFPLGTINNPGNVLIIKGLEAVGYIGSTTPGASPYTYTNLDSYNEMIYLVGGTISDISRGGQSIGPRTEHFLVPGDAITITYSSVPSIKRFGVS